MKIIFLDFDGVLNRFNDGYSLLFLSKECVENLNLLLECSKAKIVITSQWRVFHPMSDLRLVLVNAGLKYPESVIGKTPDLLPLPQKTSRGDEIEKWLKETNKHVDAFVILDDDDDMGLFMDKLVQTDSNIGLTKEKVERALRILQIPPDENLNIHK